MNRTVVPNEETSQEVDFWRRSSSAPARPCQDSQGVGQNRRLSGRIKAINRHIYGIQNENDFYAFIQANMRKQPEEYARIREINAGLETVDEEQADIMDLGKNECAASKMAQAAG